jgi:Fe2+ transport system protein B
MSFRILLCSSGLALGLRPLLSSLARAILTGIQNVSAALPFIPVFGSLVSLLEFSGLWWRLAGWFCDPVILIFIYS